MDMKEELVFTVFDYDFLSHDDPIAEYRMTLGELLRQRRNGDLQLQLGPVRETVMQGGKKVAVTSPIKKNLETFGTLVISYSLKQLYSQADYMQPLPYQRMQEVQNTIAEK